VDLLSTVATRIAIELGRKDAEIPKSATDNLVALLLSDVLPGDLRFSFHRDLSGMVSGSSLGAKTAQAVCKNADVAKLVLKSL
jgi:hypothetical protein